MPFIAGTFSPPVGESLERLGFLEFDIFGAGMPIHAIFDDGSKETVWDGNAFVDPYARASSMQYRVDRFHVALRRVGGWPTSQVRIDLDESVGGDEEDLVVVL